MFFSKRITERHFKTRPYGEIFYPAGERSGQGYMVRSDEKSEFIRRNMKKIKFISSVLSGTIFYVIYLLWNKYDRESVSVLLLFVTSGYFSNFVSKTLLHLLVRKLPHVDEITV